MSNQAAAKIILALEERGYVTRESDAIGRKKRIIVTPLGLTVVMARSLLRHRRDHAELLEN